MAAGIADNAWVFAGKRPCRRLRAGAILLAATLKMQMVEKPHNRKQALRKHPNHFPLQPGATTDPLTAETVFFHELAQTQGFLLLGKPVMSPAETPCHPKALLQAQLPAEKHLDSPLPWSFLHFPEV